MAYSGIIGAEPKENQLLVKNIPFYYTENHLHNFFVNTLGVQGLLRIKIRKRDGNKPYFFKDDLVDEKTGKITYLSNADHWDPKKGKFVYKVAILVFTGEQLATEALPIIDGSVLTGSDIEGDYFITAEKKTAIQRGPIGELSVVPGPQNPFSHFRGRYQPLQHGMAMQGSQPPVPQPPQGVVPPAVQYPGVAPQGQPGVDEAAFNALSQELDQLLM